MNKVPMTALNKQDVQAVADLRSGYTLGHADVEIIQQMALDALTLMDELEAAEKRIAELQQKSDIYDMLREDYDLKGSLVEFVDWQANRIVELEVREVNLPKPISVLHRRDFNDVHRSIYAYPEAEVNAVLAAAGIKIKGE